MNELVNQTLTVRESQRLRKQAEQLCSPEVALKEELSQRVAPPGFNKLLLCGGMV